MNYLVDLLDDLVFTSKGWINPNTAFFCRSTSCDGGCFSETEYAALRSHILYIPMMHYVHWLKLICFALYTHLFVVFFVNDGCVFSSGTLWRWKATWPFSSPLARTFDSTPASVCAHVHSRTFPLQTFLSISSSPLVHTQMLSLNTYKDKHTNGT